MAFDSKHLLDNEYANYNYIKEGNFDRLSTYSANSNSTVPPGWKHYYDGAVSVPVNGNGSDSGHTNLLNSVENGTILRGLNSWQITRTNSASSQGEGYSYAFSIDNIDKSNVLTVNFDFQTGSAFTAGDMVVYIYDVTNSTLITPMNVNIPYNTGHFSTTFAATTSTSYRLILHCASTGTSSTNWSVTFDRVIVTGQQFTYGSPISDWQSYSLTIGAVTTNPTTGTVNTNSAQWRRVGDSMEILYNFGQSTAGTAGSGNYLFPLPSGYTIDTTKLPVPGDSVTGIAGGCGHGYATTGSTQRLGFIEPYSTTQLALNTYSGSDTTSSISSTNFSLAGSTIEYFIHAVVPIVGWGSNISMATNTTEYASNDGSAGTSAGTNYDTGMQYGPSGQSFVAVASTTQSNSSTSYRVRFQNPIQPTDLLVLEFYKNGLWRPVAAQTEACQETINLNGAIYGMGITSISGSTTDIYVSFGNSGRLASGASSYGSSGTSWSGIAADSNQKWRVKKVSGPGVTQLSGNILGQQNNVAQLAGYLGEVITSTNSTGVSPSSGVVTNLTSITLSAGSWMVVGAVSFSASTISQIQGMISTSNNSQSGQLYDGSTTTISMVSGSIASSSIPVGPQIFRVPAGSTQILYLNVQVSTSGAPVAKGSITATRFM